VRHPERLKGLLRKGDVLLASTGEGVLGRCALFDSDDIYIADGHISILRDSSERFDPRFFNYWLSTRYETINGLFSQGSTKQTELQRDGFRGWTVPFPSRNLQTEIANWLDQLHPRFESALNAKQKQIDLLREAKAIVIAQAVTRGLKSDVLMKGSEVAWIGEIPLHWEARRARFVFQEIDERSDDGSEELLSVSHLTGVTPRSEKNVNMFLAESYEGYKTCQADDLVINIMWAWMGALGVAPKAGIVSSAYGVYRFRQRDRVEPQYFEYLLRTPQYIAEYNRRSTGIQSSRLRLYTGSFFDMRILLPPRGEQQAIVAHIKEKSAAIDAAIAKIEREIELVQEYRTVLISEAVTGKLKMSEARQAEAA